MVRKQLTRADRAVNAARVARFRRLTYTQRWSIHARAHEVSTMAEQATVHGAEADHAARRQSVPDEAGFFGKYGGQYLPPQLEAPFAEIVKAYHEIENDAAFIAELRYLRKHFQGRPTPVYHARTLSLANGGAQIYLKREDLNHTGAHKLNHCMGEGLLAKYMGKKKLIAETGAGQHGVALATAAAHFGLECEIHMGIVDIEKQAPNVSRMQLLGATVVPVTRGLQTLKEAVDSAFEAYLADYENSIYCIGSVVGPHPFPLMVRDFQKVVGMEAREQFVEMTGNLPDVVEACVGGGSNAIGIFSGFLDDPVELIGVEPLGRGEGVGDHAATMTYGREGRHSRLPLLSAAGRPGRAGAGVLVRQRPRLSGRRARAQLPQGLGPGAVRHLR